MATPYSEQPKVEMLYRLFSNQEYKPTHSYVLRTSVFELNPLYQHITPPYVNDVILEKEPFILSGPEYN